MIGPIVVLVLGTVVVATGILGWVGKLPRNRLVGVRTSATLRSDEAFAVGNRAAGPAITIGGIAAMAGSIVALLVPQRDANGAAVVAVLVMAVFAIIGAAQGARAADKVAS